MKRSPSPPLKNRPWSSNRGDRFLDSNPQVAFAYLLLTLAMTYPLALNWRAALPAGAGDVWQNYWNFWWWKKCLLEGLNPYRSDSLFHPFGIDLVFHTHSVFNQVAAMPVNLLFGEAAAYNFSVFVALTLSGFGCWLLVRELTGDARAGFLAGIVFAYFPQHIEQTLEHVNLFSTQFIPLTLFYVVRWTRTQRTIDALALGLCFGLNALCGWHLGLKLALVLAPWALWVLWRSRLSPAAAIRGLAAAAGAATFLTLPAVLPLLLEIASGADYYSKAPVPRGIDASYLLMPIFTHPVFGSWATPAYLQRAYQASGFICYLGFVPLGLALIAAVRKRRQAAVWLALFFVTLLLSLGKNPFWDGRLIESLTLPFVLLAEIPIIENLRVANRFLILTSLALAVMTGLGWTALSKKRRRLFPWIAGAILFEYLWLPFPIRRVEPATALVGVAERPGAVLDIPFHQKNRTVHNMAAQTVHGRPIGGGYVSTYPPETLDALAAEPALANLAGVPRSEIDPDRLRELDIRTVILHKYRRVSYGNKALEAVAPGDLLGRKNAARLGGIPDAAMDAVRTRLTEQYGPPALEDDRFAVFFLDGSAAGQGD